MLNKKVCSKCHRKWIIHFYGFYGMSIDSAFHHDFFKEREREFLNDWRAGVCRCVASVRQPLLKEKPPEQCPYFLEQIVNAKQVSV